MDLDQEGIGTVFELVMEVFTVFLFGVWKKMWNIFLKITPVEGGDADVEILDEELPECEYYSWIGGALANDGCIYFLPYADYGILKLDPNNGDSLSLVKEDLDGDWDNYQGAVLGSDNCIYGIPDRWNKWVVKFDPPYQHISYGVGNLNEEERFLGGVLVSAGNVYTANRWGQMIKLNIFNNEYTIIGEKIHNKFEKKLGLGIAYSWRG